MAEGVVAFASAAYTASQNSADLSNNNAQFVHVLINVTAIVSTPSVTFTIQGKDQMLNQYYNLLVSSAITATGLTVLKIGPGLTPVANGAASDFLPQVWRVVATHSNANSITYSVSAVLGE